MSDDKTVADHFTEFSTVQAAPFVIGIMSCKECGAAVLLEQGEDHARRHYEWHGRNNHE